MNRILCQSCEKRPTDEGCYVCRGYRYLLERSTCDCGVDYWSRPGVYTTYDGKEWTSFDGHRFVIRGDVTRCAMGKK